MMWMLGVTMSKCLADGKVEFGHIVGHYVSGTEGEARGWFLKAVQEARPGFAVDQMSCSEIPPSEMRKALGLGKRRGLH